MGVHGVCFAGSAAWRAGNSTAYPSIRIQRARDSDRLSQGRAPEHAYSGGSARLKRLEGRSRIQVKRLDEAVASQKTKNPSV